MDKKFYDKIEELQYQSNEKFIKRVSEGEIHPNFQVPYYMGVIENENVMDALNRAKEGVPGKPTLLDSGCGSGFSLMLGSEAGYDSYGIDIESGLVELAKENIEDARAKGIDVSNIKKLVHGDMYEDSSYDSLGINFDEVDVFFAYFTRGFLPGFFKKYQEEAKEGSRVILVPYHSERTLESFFKNLDSRPDKIYDGDEYHIFQK